MKTLFIYLGCGVFLFLLYLIFKTPSIKKVKILIDCFQRSEIIELEVKYWGKKILIHSDYFFQPKLITAAEDGIFILGPCSTISKNGQFDFLRSGNMIALGQTIYAITVNTLNNEIREIQSPYCGRIIKILVKHGQQIRKGDKLFLVDSKN